MLLARPINKYTSSNIFIQSAPVIFCHCCYCCCVAYIFLWKVRPFKRKILSVSSFSLYLSYRYHLLCKINMLKPIRNVIVFLFVLVSFSYFANSSRALLEFVNINVNFDIWFDDVSQVIKLKYFTSNCCITFYVLHIWCYFRFFIAHFVHQSNSYLYIFFQNFMDIYREKRIYLTTPRATITK